MRKTGIMDYRLIAMALEYAYPRQTGAIDLVLEELNYNIGEMDLWLVKRIKEDAEFYLRTENYNPFAEEQIVNEGYVNKVIYLCDNRLEELCKK